MAPGGVFTMSTSCRNAEEIAQQHRTRCVPRRVMRPARVSASIPAAHSACVGRASPHEGVQMLGEAARAVPWRGHPPPARHRAAKAAVIVSGVMERISRPDGQGGRPAPAPQRGRPTRCALLAPSGNHRGAPWTAWRRCPAVPHAPPPLRSRFRARWGIATADDQRPIAYQAPCSPGPPVAMPAARPASRGGPSRGRRKSESVSDRCRAGRSLDTGASEGSGIEVMPVPRRAARPRRVGRIRNR